MQIDETLRDIENALLGYPASRVIACLGWIEAVLSDEGGFASREYPTQGSGLKPASQCSDCNQPDRP